TWCASRVPRRTTSRPSWPLCRKTWQSYPCRSRTSATEPMKRLTVLALLYAAGAVAAQSFALQGMLGSKALLVVDGGKPKAVGAGETWQGVKVVSASGDQAVLEVGGQRQTMRVGDSPMRWGATAAPQGNKIVLSAGSGGHF